MSVALREISFAKVQPPKLKSIAGPDRGSGRARAVFGAHSRDRLFAITLGNTLIQPLIDLELDPSI